jgi:signal transduction histidine kinase
MTHDELVIIGIAAGCAAGVGVLGLIAAYALRGASLRWFPAGVALVAAAAVIAAVIGTARAMFISDHDYVVVLWVCLVAGIVSACLASLVGAVLVRSSRQLHEGARRFGESGHYEAEVTGPAEFTALNEQLRESSQKLAEAREREQRLEESRRELVSWVSHDLRTPLSGLRAMTEALEDGMVDDPSRYHRQISAEVNRTVRMVDDLFELSQMHAGLLVPSPQTVALGDLVSESLAAAESVAAVKGVRLDGHVDSDVLVHVDPNAMSRVIGNLLMNAIRHTPSDGSVQIRGWTRDDAVALSVRDGCGGIPSEEIDRVFDVAFRGGAARTPDAVPASGPVTSGSGAGLGLAIVRGLIEVHRGHVEVENVENGCRFVVTIPTSDPTSDVTEAVSSPAR